jgi:anti-sigma-K factor RskA
MIEEHVFDFLPGYALEILDDEDLLRVARHLPHCVACIAELEAYAATRDQLAFMAPVQAPAADLRARVLQKVNAESQHARAVERVPESINSTQVRTAWWDHLRMFLGRQAGFTFAVLALLIILFLGINNYLLWQRVDKLHTLLPEDQVLIARLDGTANAPGASGYVIVYRDNKYGSLTVENAPVLDENQQYQIWLIRDGERTSGGVFSVNASGYGVLQVYSHEPLDMYDSFGITIEPAGGSPAPTGEKILGGGL